MRSHRLLSIATLFTLALTTIATGANAQNQTEGTLPYIYSNYTFPSARASIARHTIRLAIPVNSKSVSALKLIAPAGFTLNKNVTISNNKTSESLPVSVGVAGQTIELSFDRAVEPGTAIDINLNNVDVWGTARYYDLAVKFASDNPTVNDGKLQSSNDRYVNIGRTGLRHP